MIFGAQYYRPPFPERSCWNRDMDNMNKLGFNTVKLWVVWNWVERNPGEFYFEELDELVAIAGKNKLKVILNVIPEGAPYWTVAGNEDAMYTTAKGERVAYGGPANIPSAGWPGLCMDKPEVAALVTKFIEEVAVHFASNDTVFAIDVWNEPHLEPMFDYRDDILCYCSHSVTVFTKWLRNKYTTLENLNVKWLRCYTDWSQIMPPPRFGTWTDMMDWRLFWLDNLRRWLKIRVDAARHGAPDKIVQTHVSNSGILGNNMNGGLANFLGDEFLLAQEVDMFGLSSFPKWLMGKNYILNHLAHNEMVAEASRGKTFYQVELQGGAGKAGLLGGEVPDARDIRLWNWNTIVAGGKGVVYWQYAPEPAGIESPGFGLTGFKGENTIRSIAAGECAVKLSNITLENACRIPATNAIYISRHSDVLCYCAGRSENLYAGSIMGVYKAAYKHSIPIRFFHEDYVENILSEGVKVLYIPMPLILSKIETNALLSFVEEGGTIISEACPGLYDRFGLLDQKSEVLETLFGLEHVEVQGTPDWGPVRAYWNNSDAGFSGMLYRQVVEPSSETRVLCSFVDGRPAVTERQIGKGKAIWIGTFASYNYNVYEDEETSGLLLRWFDQGGFRIIRNIRVSTVNGSTSMSAPVIRLFETESEYILVLVNHLCEEIDISIEFNSPMNIRDENSYKNDILTIKLKASDGKTYSWKK